MKHLKTKVQPKHWWRMGDGEQWSHLVELQVLLNEYESLVRAATLTPISPSVRDIREKRAWYVYKFLIKCGVDKSELAKIEEEYNF